MGARARDSSWPGKLKDSGLGVDQVGGFATKIVAFIKDKAGDEMVGKVLAAVPALKQYVD